MIISKKNSQLLSQGIAIQIPMEDYFSMPEKVLQFGTGVLLRGLPGYFIDKANKQGIFNGRIVIVKSTSQGSADAFEQQDGLYTTFIRGIEEGRAVDEIILNASISRVLSAATQWEAVLDCAFNPDLSVILSNTTEVGLSLDENDRIAMHPPHSFPGKLLAFLYKRFLVFAGNADSGFVIIPTELIPGNGEKLKTIVKTLAHLNELGDAFMQWLETANYFCSSLVDRIVPGKLKPEEKEKMEAQLGYEDDLMIMAEPYRLWAIESADEKVKGILSFSKADKGVVIAADISKFRELKLRLLNGSHTFSCGLAVVAGFSTVKQAMSNERFKGFVTKLMLDEIAPAIVGPGLTEEEAKQFSAAVIDRFCNPYIEHEWLNITLQYSSKMMMRNVPVLQKYYTMHASAPKYMALGFAGYILFMKPEKEESGKYLGRIMHKDYWIQDDKAAILSEKWKAGNTEAVVKAILSDPALWGTDLTALTGFAEKVSENLEAIVNNGVEKTMAEL